MDDGVAMAEAVRDAAHEGRDKELLLLLSQGGNHSAPNQLEHTPLMLAALGGHLKCCQILLLAGADPNQVSFNQKNALLYAVLKNHHECAEFLLNHVNPNSRDNEGRSALTIAMIESDARMVLMLAPRVDYTRRTLFGGKNDLDYAAGSPLKRDAAAALIAYDLAMREMSAISKASPAGVEESVAQAPKVRL